MGVFGDHARRFADKARTAATTARQSVSDYTSMHGSTMPGPSEYLKSAAGRASMRSAVGTGVSRAIASNTAKSFRKGNYVMGSLLTLAGHAFASHMQNLKNDQRIFENTAKVLRGDPQVHHMSHQDLREVRDNASKYGGPHADAVHSGAHGELSRRQITTAREQNARQALKDTLAHEHRQGLKELGHQEHIRRLRETQGHTHDALIATQQRLRDIHKQVQSVHTSNVKTRQQEIRKTIKERANLHVMRKTAHGAVVMDSATGKTFYESDAKLAASKKPRAPRKRAV